MFFSIYRLKSYDDFGENNPMGGDGKGLKSISKGNSSQVMGEESSLMSSCREKVDVSELSVKNPNKVSVEKTFPAKKHLLMDK